VAALLAPTVRFYSCSGNCSGADGVRVLLGSIFVALAALLGSTGGALSQPLGDGGRDAVFGFVGVELDGLALPIGFEDNYLLGVGYQRAWGDWSALLYGIEGGLAGRFSEKASLEAWGGLFARYNFNVESVRVAPAFTFGLSAITETMAGGESENVADYGGDATLLFYLGPEISFGLTEHPEYEVFARLHHRSGAWGTLGDMHGATDVLAIGFRSFIQ
jgi:hypothetical protein